MYCKLTTYNKMNVCSEGFKNPRYVVDLQEITPPPPDSLNTTIADTAFILERQQLLEPFVVSVLFI